jgi:hypothetical protein
MNFSERKGGLNINGSISLPKNVNCPTIKPTQKKLGMRFSGNGWLSDASQNKHRETSNLKMKR